MALKDAIRYIEAQLDDLALGTTRQPPEGSQGWFLARAWTLGVAFLRRADQMAGDPQQVENLYRSALKTLKLDKLA